MKRTLTVFFFTILEVALCQGAHRHWTVADGLPTGEVWQIEELPNGQMLVNCEGVFCLSNGSGFDIVNFDYSRTHQMPTYASGYGRLWQGDSLLWLHDFYRLFLFDVRQRTFRYDVEQRLSDATLRRFAEGEVLRNVPDSLQWHRIDSLGYARNYGTMAQDRQGGLWIGTRNNGIIYLSPRQTVACELSGGHPLIGIARSFTDRQGRIWRCRSDGLEVESDGTYTLYNVQNIKGLPYNRTTFISELTNGRYILCDSLSTLGYFYPDERRFVSLNTKLQQLKAYRHFVGACTIDQQWTAIYAQSGIILLDTRADTLAQMPAAQAIGRHATKYNCMLKDRDGRLWIGTQNGLFCIEKDDATKPLALSSNCKRMEGLTNNCIRSLVLDKQGQVWAGTSYGISRITPSVLNLGPEDGVPAVAMMERAACTTDDGHLVFAIAGDRAVMFAPDSLKYASTPPLVITGCWAGTGKAESLLPQLPDIHLSYKQAYITLQFSTLDYAAPSHTSYRYRLLPLQEWTTVSGADGVGSAVYAALPPGSYTFEVQASTTDGGWGETTAITISIRPPVWLTWWAKLIYALVAIALFTTFLNAYLKRRRQQMERENEARINQLFELREEARHQFAQAVNIEPEKIATNREEELLVEKMLKAIGQNMDNCDYTVDQLATDLGMSRAKLYKKMQTLLGITPNDFMRNVRLKHAAQLLAETSDPVNQISLLVGFQTSRYFSQCFRQMFGVTPSEYRAGKRED